MEVMFLVLLFVVGACFGSFLCCQVRRLRYRTTHKRKTGLGSRSCCLSCKHQLAWYDNIPVLSWFLLGGKCRNCGKAIGYLEIISEIGVALAFVALGTTIDVFTADPLSWATFIVILLLTLILAFLAIYDGAYGELPTKYLAASILVALVALALEQIAILIIFPFTPEVVLAPLASVVILGGLYLALYLVSGGKWVGDGDWLLGTAVGLALADPWLALIALCIANLLACLAIVPMMRKTRRRKIHFGPFMVAAFVITYTFSGFFLGLI